MVAAVVWRHGRAEPDRGHYLSMTHQGADDVPVSAKTAPAGPRRVSLPPVRPTAFSASLCRGPLLAPAPEAPGTRCSFSQAARHQGFPKLRSLRALYVTTSPNRTTCVWLRYLRPTASHLPRSPLVHLSLPGWHYSMSFYAVLCVTLPCLGRPSSLCSVPSWTIWILASGTNPGPGLCLFPSVPTRLRPSSIPSSLRSNPVSTPVQSRLHSGSIPPPLRSNPVTTLI